jgi:hypothetical protein
MFRRRLDERLCALNADYSVRRAKDFGLRAPSVAAVRPGTFVRWMKKRGRLGGQHKIPRIINDEALFADLRDFASVP